MRRVYCLLAVWLVLMFCATAMPVSAAADATITVGTVAAKAGETVTVPVSITHLDNIASIGFHVWYDPAALKCVSAEMNDTIASMNMANANIKPVRHENTVILTAINLKPVILDGVVLTVTFEVLPDAPDGLATVKIQSEGLSVSTTDLVELTVDSVSGGVMIGDGATSAPDAEPETTTAAPTTVTKVQTTATTVKKADSEPSQSTASGVTQTTAAPNGENEPLQAATTMPELPEETVVDIVGNIVTNAQGEPTKVKTVGVIVSSATAEPDETVTIKVSVSEVSKLTALGLSVHFDTTALSFEGGECIGFVKDGASMSAVLENASGVVDISAMAAKGMSGTGEIAELRFKVKNTAKNGEYRLAVKGDPLLQTSEYELPIKAVAGTLRVEGAAQQSSGGLYAAIGVVAASAVAALIVWLCLRRKKAAPVVNEAPKAPAVINVSGEDDE